ncbi:MBL fold metallo-hydrolase [Paenibacillus sp. 481]|uniref:MBL fold metallo-hydrolase n=1 Tax=Paenibacillus sp. 481 TaxID=2835869 RepID=UPI001E561F89|nr:MBL fold metallo-hydrolase [Paenibacillus sp. 481]
MGVPRVYCACEVCQEARQSGLNRRYRSSVLLARGEERLLVDCGPDWTWQMEQAGLYWLDHILITHAHHDHIAGLPAYADACRWLERTGCVIAPAEVNDTIRIMYPWLDKHIRFVNIDGDWCWSDWSIKPIKVNHGKNGYAYAYRFERDGTSWVYASDAIGLEAEELVLFRKAELLILGTNFYYEQAPYHTRSVYDMVEAMQLIKDVQPKRTIFTHMSHDIDLRRTYPLPDHVALAKTGLTVSV